MTARPQYQVLSAAILLTVVIAVVDHATGVKIRVYPLYFLPIALAAWHAPGPTSGVLLPLLCTAAWVGSNALPEPQLWKTTTWTINTVMQGVAFTTVGFLIRRLRSRLEEEQAIARRDPLTGLSNNRAFHEYGNALVASTARAGQPITLAYLDLDNFKSVNDMHGHLEGDLVLRAVAGALLSQLRTSDLAARLGGDEFAILLPNTGCDGARTLLERVTDAVRTQMRAGGWPVTASVGAIGYAHAPDTLAEALRRADGLMYTAKRAGKNQIHVEAAETDGGKRTRMAV